MEMSTEMFERLVSMLAENRAAIQTAETNLNSRIGEVRKNLGLMQAQLQANEEDLGEVQKELRAINIVLARHDESFEGLTQLTKTNFNMTESVLKHIHGEAGELSHEQEESNEEAKGDRRG